MHRFMFLAYVLCLAGCGGSSGSECGDIAGSYVVTSRPDKSLSNTCPNTPKDGTVDITDVLQILANGEGMPHEIQVSDDGDGTVYVQIPGVTGGSCPGRLTKCDLEVTCDAVDSNGQSKR
jgi:hypothetical protein